MASFDLSYSQYPVLKEIWVTPKIGALPPGTLFQLRKFRHETPISTTCCRLDLTKVDAQCAKHTYLSRNAIAEYLIQSRRFLLAQAW